VPIGYFSIFKELADIFVMLIRKGANLGPTFVPDISVGQLWSKFWVSENLEILYGERIKYEHTIRYITLNQLRTRSTHIAIPMKLSESFASGCGMSTWLSGCPTTLATR
jgi:hypothetical protein